MITRPQHTDLDSRHGGPEVRLRNVERWIQVRIPFAFCVFTRLWKCSSIFEEKRRRENEQLLTRQVNGKREASWRTKVLWKRWRRVGGCVGVGWGVGGWRGGVWKVNSQRKSKREKRKCGEWRHDKMGILVKKWVLIPETFSIFLKLTTATLAAAAAEKEKAARTTTKTKNTNYSR